MKVREKSALQTALAVLLVFTLAVACAESRAQQPYPQRPVRIVVNVGAGGGVDSIARVVAQHYAAVWGQSFIVDNRPGAGGSIGIDRNPALAHEHQAAQIVDAVRMVGVGVRVEHAVNVLDASRQQLLARVGRGIDENGGAAPFAEALDEERATPPPVPGVGGIAVAPDVADTGHAAR